ncbi:hypothetical protein [Streptomyces solicathayae]|uniref:Uncharacterized protein n=1 Tax=Streptomyces solicathayae TaxID=3081768 RepID=A0ABZ0M5K5_9ACTN|nr:hypothetical protein [Streptomyces sp. HUAS YS2]WOX26339.1 hypothetical protein R2D22_35145 [Streptomyces sp. HUAS YS2]
MPAGGVILRVVQAAAFADPVAFSISDTTVRGVKITRCHLPEDAHAVAKPSFDA